MLAIKAITVHLIKVARVSYFLRQISGRNTNYKKSLARIRFDFYFLENNFLLGKKKGDDLENIKCTLRSVLSMYN